MTKLFGFLLLTTMVVNNIHVNLIAIGFSEYEAKAYTTLIGTNPATAYEIAKLSGVPSSKIYEVLSRLLEKGFVLATNSGEKRKYIPLHPDEFINSQKNEFSSRLESLHKDLHSITYDSGVSYIWNINEYHFLMQKAQSFIADAKQSILLSAWPDDLSNLADILSLKREANCAISIVHFGKPELHIGCVFQHPIEDTLYSEKGGRGFLLIVDEKIALMGTISPDHKVEGAWSMNKGFVALAEDYIKHDIYIMKIVKRFNQQLKKKFGEHYEMLRDIFNDMEV